MMRRSPAEDAITIVIGAKPKKVGDDEEEMLPEDELGDVPETEEDLELERLMRRLGV